jgi:hypothetical protein
MIEPVTQSRWQEAQAAELAVVQYDEANSYRATQHIFNYLGMEFDQWGKTIAEIGCGPYPASLFCEHVLPRLYEPLWFLELKQATKDPCVRWYREPFEDAPLIEVEECWLFNCLQHVRDPELVISKAKQTAPVIRFFEPVDYPTCVYHPHTFAQSDFERWFGSQVKRYTDRLPGFFDDDCCYGTWGAE